MKTIVELTAWEADMIRQWYEMLVDTNARVLREEDHQLGKFFISLCGRSAVKHELARHESR